MSLPKLQVTCHNFSWKLNSSMHLLCEFVTKQITPLGWAPDVFIVQDSLFKEDGDSNLFSISGRRDNFRSSDELYVSEALADRVAADYPKQKVAIIVNACFDEWDIVKLIADQTAKQDVVLLMLAPTGASSMHQAALSQFSVETAIRAQSFGMRGDFHIVGKYSAVDLGSTVLGSLKSATLLGRLLVDIASSDLTQIAILAMSFLAEDESHGPTASPMFTVLTRTQGTRMETLREVFLCLSAQTNGDFEHLVIAHNPSAEAVVEIRQLIADQSDWMRSRIRFEQIFGGTRTTPLNGGFAKARGKYVVILDDDDIVFANWLETFNAIAREEPGTLLRAVAVRQEFTWTEVGGKRSAKAVSAMHREYAPKFDFLDHLEVSQTPPVSIAFPRYLFADYGLRFDEALTTTEDWDYIMRCAARVGVGNSEEITCIYRWWVNAENSRTVHGQSEWQENHFRIQDKIDACVNLVPPGSMSRYREILEKMNEYLRWANKLHHDLLDIQAVTQTNDADQAKAKIAELSTSVQGELTSLLKDVSPEMLPLAPPVNDLLPQPKLAPWQGLLGKRACMARLMAKLRRDTIISSGLFDADWYLAKYPDVAEQNIDPLTHFVQFGSRELRSPSAEFNARNYYAANMDLRDHRIEPVFHFILRGKKENRRYEVHT